MAAQKRSACGNLSNSSSKNQKHQVTVATFEKWLRENDREYQTLHWLRCEKDPDDRSLVSTLWYVVCRKYEKRIISLRNYSDAWVKGSTNHKTSNIVDHARSDCHVSAMSHMRTDVSKANNETVETYAPIARMLLKLDDQELGRLRKKFDIYLLAREGLAFRKYPPIYELENMHGMNLGASYKGSDSAQVFTHFIAEAQRKQFLDTFSEVRFFSFMMDGSVDAGNVENELVILLYSKCDDEAKEMKSCVRYWDIVQPAQSNADGLVASLCEAMKSLGIENVTDGTVVLATASKLPLLVGGGTDGASVNVGIHNGMKQKMQSTIPWLILVMVFLT